MTRHHARRGTGHLIHVLVVDDSAVVRTVLTDVLTRTGEFTVETATDPIAAAAKVAGHRPDVVILDLEMPRMHGLEYLQALMADRPIPTIVLSSITTERSSEMAVKALQLGAADVVGKPGLLVKAYLEDVEELLLDKIRACARHELAPSHRSRGTNGRPRVRTRGVDVIGLGASMGGVRAIHTVLSTLPANTPPILCVQHMPARFTPRFAQMLDETCEVSVREATDGEALRSGVALVARGDHHLAVVKRGSTSVVRLIDGPFVENHRPSVDVLFRSIARTAGARSVGVIMTGMGKDGARGLKEIRTAGGATYAQDAASSVTFGMARRAIEIDAVTEVADLAGIAQLLANLQPQ